MIALLNAAIGQWPLSQYSTVPEVSVAEFTRAFDAQAMFYRQPNLHKDFGFGHFVTVANDRLRTSDMSEVSWRALWLACIAPGDVTLSDWPRLKDEGVTPAAGLNEYTGVRPRDQWRATLENKFLSRFVPDRLRKGPPGRAEPRRVRILDGEGNEFQQQGPRIWNIGPGSQGPSY
jgi:hypothetical protein